MSPLKMLTFTAAMALGGAATSVVLFCPSLDGVATDVGQTAFYGAIAGFVLGLVVACLNCQIPRRTSIEFSLRTWFALIAALAIAVSVRPHFGLRYFSWRATGADWSYGWQAAQYLAEDETYCSINITLGTNGTPSGTLLIYFGPYPQLFVLLVALLAFLAWKAIRLWRDRRQSSLPPAPAR